MTLLELQLSLYKIAAEEKDPGASAMAGAASVAKPSWAPAMPDFTKGKEKEEDTGMDPMKELKDRDKEIERLKNEKRVVELNLLFELIKAKQNEAARQLEQQERASLEKIRQEQLRLDQKKTLHQAEAIKHQADLARLESDSQLKIQQDKNKSLMDLHNQQLKMQMATADLQMKMQMQSADKARAAADKYKDNARKQIDKERADMQKAYNQAHAGLSPALNHTMQGAIKALSLFGKPTKVKIPKPGTAPEAVELLRHPKSQLHTAPVDLLLEKFASKDINIHERVADRIKSIPSINGTVMVKLAELQPSLRTPLPVRLQSTPTDLIATRADHGYFGDRLFGQGEMIGGMLGTFLGPAFNFYDKSSIYDLYNKKDMVADSNMLLELYRLHKGSPTLEKMHPHLRWTTPGQDALNQAFQR